MMEQGDTRFVNLHGEDRVELITARIDDVLEHVRAVDRDDEHALLDMQVSFDNASIARAFGSPALCLAAFREAWTIIAPLITRHSYVEVRVFYGGTRSCLFERVPR